MTIDVLVCKPDGTQYTEQREVADDYFDISVQPAATLTLEDRVTSLETDVDQIITGLEGMAT